MTKKAPPAKSKKQAPPASPVTAKPRGDKSFGQKAKQRSRAEKLGRYMTGQ